MNRGLMNDAGPPGAEPPRRRAGAAPVPVAAPSGDALPTRTPPGPQELIARGNIPRHVAIIMDGNGRWAKARGVPRLMGHRAGRESVREAGGRRPPPRPGGAPPSPLSH